jgi:hypothetical protein
MDSQKQQAAERIKQANNILVTVSNNPSVDQLAACIGLTLTLNKMGKHATAVYSGSTPSTIEFLQPEKTLEKNTDSLRDFIIALDKSKADKLRYKVEDRVVKIFITPYKTSINEKDLEFSQGDFNVDVVVALGVHSQAELDQAITSHGRILHDATVVTMNVKPGGELGSINWLDPNASSLSELATQLIDMLDKKLIDGQVSTALLTGIVAETERFSNAKTTPQTMSISAELMGAGANQQLVATKLEEPAPPPPPAMPIAQEGEKPAEGEAKPEAKKSDDGTLEITHDEKSEGEAKPAPEGEKSQEESKPEEKPAPEAEPAPEQEKKEEPQEEPAVKPEESKPEPELEKPAPTPTFVEETPEPAPPQIHIDEHGSLTPLEDLLPPKAPSEPPAIIRHSEAPKMVLEPPTLGGQLTASATPGLGEAEEQPSGLPNHENMTVTPSVGHTIMPPAPGNSGVLDFEQPAGGSAPADSFLVGSGNPTAPTGSVPVIVPPAPVGPTDGPLLPDAPLGTGRTLSDIEQDVHSPHADATSQPEDAGPANPSPSDAMLPPLPTQDNPIMPPAPATPEPAAMPAPDSSQGDPTAFDINNFTTSDAGNAPAPDLNVQPAAPFNPLGDTPAATDGPSSDVNSARDAVEQAISGSPSASLDPIEALNAQAVNLPLGAAGGDNAQAPVGIAPGINVVEPEQSVPNADPNAPPPVPPPMMPPTNPY